jgi:hypothetical protein
MKYFSVICVSALLIACGGDSGNESRTPERTKNGNCYTLSPGAYKTVTTPEDNNPCDFEEITSTILITETGVSSSLGGGSSCEVFDKFVDKSDCTISFSQTCVSDSGWTSDYVMVITTWSDTESTAIGSINLTDPYGDSCFSNVSISYTHL